MDKAQIAQSLLLEPLNEALSLYRRYQEGKGLKYYMTERMALLLPIGLLMAVTSIACAAATVLYLGGTRSFLVLLAILLVPFVLLGSAFVQAYVFFSWLENRAIAKDLHRRPKPAGPVTAKLLEAGIDLGSRPPVPWVLAALFLLLPLAMLWLVVPQLAFLLIALHVAAPFAFARLDR